MSYAPSTFNAGTGEDFFLKEGFLTGMAPLITARYTIPAFDDTDGSALTITNSVAKSAAGAVPSWSGWNLAAAKTKLLVVAYVQPHTTNFTGVGFHTGTLPGSTLEDSYQGTYYYSLNSIRLVKYTGGSVGYPETETTFRHQRYNGEIAGIALYVEDDIQKVFVNSGASQWVQVLAGTDTDHDSFQSVVLWHNGLSCRFVSPIYCWGS